MADLTNRYQDFKEAKLNLAVIGSGPPRDFDPFRKATAYPGPLYSDPSLAVFDLLGFRRDLLGVASISAAFKAMAAIRQGHRQGRISGSTLQLGGAVIIAPDNTIPFYHASKTAGDHPRIRDLIRAGQES